MPGLKKEDFTLFEDKKPQEITDFAAEHVAVSICVVFDVSASMARNLPLARRAVAALLGNIMSGREFCFVKFSSEAEVMVPMTSRLEEMRRALGRLTPGGGTALLDGIRLAMHEMTSARYSRKVIIIISDGEDNSSHWTTREVETAARQRDIVIYAIGISDSKQSEALALSGPGEQLLAEIAVETGGRVFPNNRSHQLREIAAKIAESLRGQYLLGYVPSQRAMDGSYRKVDLKIARPKGFPQLRAVWRQGYFSPRD